MHGRVPLETNILKPFRSLLTLCGLCFLGILGTVAQQQRPPAIPLIAHDPYFSIWSRADHLTDAETVHWTGSSQPLSGVVRIDGKPYRNPPRPYMEILCR